MIEKNSFHEETQDLIVVSDGKSILSRIKKELGVDQFTLVFKGVSLKSSMNIEICVLTDGEGGVYQALADVEVTR